MSNGDDAKGQEPSMEEILSSIRKIISEDSEQGGAASAAPDAEELVLTEVVADQPAAAPAAPAAPEPVELDLPPEPAPPVPPPPPHEEPLDFEPQAAPPPAVSSPPAPAVSSTPIASASATKATAGAFAQLAHAVQTKDAVTTGDFDAPLGGGQTIETLAVQLLKPMLREWIDQNLPQMVERLVAQEIKRMTGGM